MHASITVATGRLAETLLHVAVVRPMFIWGPPGIGKSTLVGEFAESLGIECVSLLGTQLAPEDLIGIPRIVETESGDRSRFCPPETIARDEPYVLFLDELNGPHADGSLVGHASFNAAVLDQQLVDDVVAAFMVGIANAAHRREDRLSELFIDGPRS